MKIFNNIKKWIFEAEENEDDIAEKESSQFEIIEKETIAILKIKDMNNIIHCCDLLKQGNAIIFNLEEMKEERQRFLDFISGVLMATDGVIRKLNNDIIVCIPSNIKIIEEYSVDN